MISKHPAGQSLSDGKKGSNFVPSAAATSHGAIPRWRYAPSPHRADPPSASSIHILQARRSPLGDIIRPSDAKNPFRSWR
jgi:hypothetical protein